MSDRDLNMFIVDIFIAIDKVRRYTQKFTCGEELLYSEMEWDAVIRELQIIGDATNELLKAELIDNILRRIVDFRNQIVHGYFGIDHDIVWEVISKKLPIYNSDLLEIVKTKQIDLTEAINSALIDNAYNRYTIDLLKEIQKKI